jgi:hypothetical protein
MSYNESEILAHVKNAILETPIVEAPFPYACFSNVFPSGFYDRIVATIPERKLFTPYFVDRPKSENQTFVLHQNYLCDPSQPEAEGWIIYWKGVSLISKLLSFRFEPYIPSVLRVLFPEDWGKRVLDIETYFETGNLHDAGTGYQIGPHLDHPYHIVTWLFNMPQDNKFLGCGTDMYHPVIEDMDAFDPLVTFFSQYRGGEFDTIHSSPYKPNSLVAFMNSPISFHGYAGSSELQRRFQVMNYIRYTDESFKTVFRGLSDSVFEISRLGPEHKPYPVEKFQ